MHHPNQRVNVTLEPEMNHFLTDLAKKEKKSVSSLIKELISDALDRREDICLSTLAKVWDIPTAKKIKHDDAWK